MMGSKVVLVPFPFDDLRATRVRPAVCLTDPVGPHRHVIMAFISSRTPADLLEIDLILDSRAGRLCHDRVTSDIHASVLHRLMTVTTALIRRELGGLSPRMQDEVANRLRRLFGLT